MIDDVIYIRRIILCFTFSMLDFLMLMLQHVLVVTSLYDITNDLVSILGCYTWGVARAHDGLMMLL